MRWFEDTQNPGMQMHTRVFAVYIILRRLKFILFNKLTVHG